MAAKRNRLTNLRDLDLAPGARLLQLLLEHLILEGQVLAQALHGILHVNAAQHLLFQGFTRVSVEFAQLLQFLSQLLQINIY